MIPIDIDDAKKIIHDYYIMQDHGVIDDIPEYILKMKKFVESS
jgi:hypothetical protein